MTFQQQPLEVQAKTLTTAFARLDKHGAPKGSWLRAAMFRECARVARALSDQGGGTRQASLQASAHDPAASLIGAMATAMTINVDDLGDVNNLAPSGVMALAAAAAQPAADKTKDNPDDLEGAEATTVAAKSWSNLLQSSLGDGECKGLPPKSDEEPHPADEQKADGASSAAAAGAAAQESEQKAEGDSSAAACPAAAAAGSDQPMGDTSSDKEPQGLPLQKPPGGIPAPGGEEELDWAGSEDEQEERDRERGG